MRLPAIPCRRSGWYAYDPQPPTHRTALAGALVAGDRDWHRMPSELAALARGFEFAQTLRPPWMPASAMLSASPHAF